MAAKEYTVTLTDDQLGAIADLFRDKGWTLTATNNNRYDDMKEAADDYVALQNQKQTEQSDRGSPTEVEEGRSPLIRRRVKREPKQAGSSFKLDKTQGSFKDMKETGMKYTFMRSSSGPQTSNNKVPTLSVSSSTAPGNPNSNRKSQGQWRLSKWTDDTNEKEIVSDISFNHFLVSDNKMVKVITKLGTEHVRTVSRVPVRIVLLVDRSGSMLHKLGRDARHTKITKVKHFAKQLIANLDDGDEVAVVTFGEDADVFFPLEKINKQSRSNLTEKLNQLDKGSMSRVTNLSAGLRMALKVFYNGSNSQSTYLASKNCILVFSDGEINSGTTDTNSLIHEVRQNIRQMVPSLDETQNQWVTISVVTTGTTVSEQVYMLSKSCSSEAYYFIDKETEDPEMEFFLPVLMRKAAVAWNISYIIEAFHGIKFMDEKCSKDNRVRLRRSISGKGAHAEKAYFLYDFPAGHSKEIGVCSDLNNVDGMESLEETAVVFKLRVEYTNINGERYWQEQLITKADMLEAAANKDDVEANAAAYKHELRLVTGDVFRSAAEHIKAGDKRKTKDAMVNGQKDLKALLDGFGERSQTGETTTKIAEVTQFAKCVVENMGALVETIESASTGTTWNRIKAVSTAIARESPNVSDTVVDGGVLCPFPDINQMETGAMSDPLQRLMDKNRKQKRVTFGNLDTLLGDVLLSP